MDFHQQKNFARIRRRARVRARVSGTAERPRLSVYRSLGHIYAQLIDDTAGKTLASASDLVLSKQELSGAKGKDKMQAKAAVAYAVGKALALQAAKKGISSAVFDRGGFAYKGRVAALADGARNGGLKF